MDQRFNVSFEVPYRYDVWFTTGVFDVENGLLAATLASREPNRRHRMLCVVDAGVAKCWPELVPAITAYAEAHSSRLALAGAPVIVPGGETVKANARFVTELQAQMAGLGLDRQSFTVIVGGGAVQDMAGFAAATAHRGLRVVRIPTTVLSQNDAGVGVKNGINAFGFKNFIGSFAPPFAVLNDSRFLDTLETRDRIAGIAEAIKVSLIRDAAFFDWLCKNAARLRALDPSATEYMIRRSAELHLCHIASAGDPFEFGSARPLDLGHWAAHKLENLTRHRLRHGEAVAIGLALDARYSALEGLLDTGSLGRILTLLEGVGLPTYDSALEARDAEGQSLLLLGLREFQEHLGGDLSVTLLEGVERPLEVHHMDPELVLGSVAWLAERHTSRASAPVAFGAAE